MTLNWMASLPRVEGTLPALHIWSMDLSEVERFLDAALSIRSSKDSRLDLGPSSGLLILGEHWLHLENLGHSEWMNQCRISGEVLIYHAQGMYEQVKTEVESGIEPEAGIRVPVYVRETDPLPKEEL